MEDLPLAVYGSLRPPYSTMANLGISDRVEHLGPCYVEGRLVDFGDYPALIEGGGRVRADLFAVGDDALAVLDRFESYYPEAAGRSMYLRKRIRLLDPDREAWVYVYQGDPGSRPLVESGDWVGHLATRGRDGSLG